jgi:hypothetical protein
MSLTDEQLRERLASVSVDADVDDGLAVVHRRGRARRRRRLALVAGTGVAVLALGVGAVLATRDGDTVRRSVVAQPVPSTVPTTPTTTLVPSTTERISPAAIRRFSIDPRRHAGLMALTDGAVWVGSFDTGGAPCHVGCGRVDRLDPATGDLVASVTIAKNARAMTVSGNVLWVLADVPDGSPVMIIGIDTTTDQVVFQQEVAGTSVQGDTTRVGIGAGAGSVWAYFGALLLQVDPATGAVARVANLPTAPSIANGIFGDEHRVWIVRNGGTTLGVWEIDVQSMAARDFASLPGGFIQSAAFDGTTIWLTEFDGTRADLFAIDAQSGAVRRTGNATTNVVTGGGRVWFQGFAAAYAAATHPGWVVEVDPSTGAPERIGAIDYAGTSPPTLAADATTLWVLGDQTLWRIGA